MAWLRLLIRTEMRLLLLFLALSAAVLISWMIWGQGLEQQFSLAGSVRWLENAGPWGWAAGLLLLVGDLILPIPGTVVMSALGFIYGPLLGGITAAAGSMLAGLAGYGVGRFFPSGTARRWLGERDYEVGHRLFTRRGGWVVALSRALPILPEVISCTAGLMRMPFRRFLLALASGALPVGFIFASVGAAGRTDPAWAAALAIVLPLGFWLVASRILER